MNTKYPSLWQITGLFICVAGLQWLSRYAGAPIVGFVSDDWSLLERARNCPDYLTAWSYILYDSDRPLMAGFITVLYKLFDDRLWMHAAFAMLGNTLGLWFLMGMVLGLTNRLSTTLIFGILFAGLPILYESFQWTTMTAYLPAWVGYTGSACFFVWYLRRLGNKWLLGLSMLFYFVGTGSYEYGLVLPACYAMLTTRENWRHMRTALIGFGVVLSIYLTWRITDGLGMARGLLFPAREVALSIDGLLWNTSSMLRWWCGDLFLQTTANGLLAFSNEFRGISSIIWMGLNSLAALLCVYSLHRLYKAECPVPSEEPPANAFNAIHIYLFCTVWIILGVLPAVISWTPARMNLFPSVGVALLLAYLLNGKFKTHTLGFCLMYLLLFLPVNQGSSVQWKEAGQLCHQLFDELKSSKESWINHEYIVWDSTSLHQNHRQSSSATSLPEQVGMHGNASFIRGFTLISMLNLAADGQPTPISLLDVEHNAVVRDGTLYWNKRFDPSQPFETPADTVYLYELFPDTK